MIANLSMLERMESLSWALLISPVEVELAFFSKMLTKASDCEELITVPLSWATY